MSLVVGSAALNVLIEVGPCLKVNFYLSFFCRSAGMPWLEIGMQAAMSDVIKQGERELCLVLTLANTPAVNLYTKLGFQLERE